VLSLALVVVSNLPERSEAVNGSSLITSVSLLLEIARCRIACSLAVLLLFGSFCGIAECDDPPPVKTPQRSGLPSADQSNSARPPDRAEIEYQIVTLSQKAVALAAQDDIEGALVVQRELVSSLEDLPDAANWRLVNCRARNEQAFLTELQQVSKLSAQDRVAYLVARQRLADGCNQMVREEYESAERLFSMALEILAPLLGDNSPSVAGTLEQLGLSYLMRKEPAKAKEFFVRAVAARKAISGEDHPDYSNALKLMGGACLEAKDFDQADVFFRDAMDRDRKLFGARSPRYADGLLKLARVLVVKERWPEAEALCLQGISIVQHAQGASSMAVVPYLRNFADINIRYEEYEAAEANLRRCIAIYERTLPPGHVGTAEVRDRRAWVLQKMNGADEAKVMETRAEPFRKQLR